MIAQSVRPPGKRFDEWPGNTSYTTAHNPNSAQPPSRSARGRGAEQFVEQGMQRGPLPAGKSGEEVGLDRVAFIA
jgi:hypothetical protein